MLVKRVFFFPTGDDRPPKQEKWGIVGAMGFGPCSLANRPQPTKDYNWAGPADLACKPNSRVETHISSHIRKGVVMQLCLACHLSRLEALFSKCCRVNSPEENTHPSLNHAKNITWGEQALSRSSIWEHDYLKGRTSLQVRDMRHLLLPIWEEITHFPRKMDPLPL